MRLLLLSLLLCGCARHEAVKPPPAVVEKPTLNLLEPKPQALLTIDPAPPAPALHFRIWHQDAPTYTDFWRSLATDNYDDIDLTLEQAVEYGMPADVFIFCLEHYGLGRRIPIYLLLNLKV
jgi:hypothetical protein